MIAIKIAIVVGDYSNGRSYSLQLFSALFYFTKNVDKKSVPNILEKRYTRSQQEGL